MKTFVLDDLIDDFDDDLSKSIMELEIDRMIDPESLLMKSIYQFDLETPEGVDRLLEVLPILDPEIMLEIYQEIFPMYPVDTLAPRVARIELRGYLMDYLNGEYEEGQQEQEEFDQMAAGNPPEEQPGMEQPEQGPAGGAGEDAMAQGAGPEGAPDEAAAPEAGAEF